MARTSIKDLFDEDDLKRIREAARDAEGRTSGEIVAYLVNRVDDHEEAVWKAAALGALAAAAIGGFSNWLGDFWGLPTVLWMTLPAFAGGSLGYLLASFSPTVERWLIAASSLDRRIRLRAEAAFLEEEIFATRERTGILIFVTLFEHRAMILADSGIHQKVDQGVWQTLVTSLVEGIRRDRTTDALVEIIGRCGALLEEHGVARREDDRDELANEPRLRER